MKNINLYHPFEIDVKELDSFPKVLEINNFFKLIYIIDGIGVQFIGNNRFDYRKGNLFLITPQDTHSFEITTPTKFFFLRFEDSFFSPKVDKEKDMAQHMDYILQNASHRPGCILKNKADKPLIALLVESILNELENEQLYHQKIIEQIVTTMITVVARNIALKLPKNIKENTGETVLEILNYIQQNIFEPKMLKSEIMSAHFGISNDYLGKYFKKQVGETLQGYISNYKLRLIETRLLHSDMRIGEIAYELNYADESHLNKAFKKFKGISPSEYRKRFSN
ncbi:AraC family transcriptional regulator [Flavobacterium soyangense]|uniref:Helix-turn-helix domain-containing protein n=1 Tax=Flavobacterium soyangense TaxID=2023265 RepID=A0A930UEF8_9FLAO|nr:AraC family transcriptional regulator [Flavobacterium soyangense]MBF2709811.1 helix-turn-helix domain-containing protein [Flavobacterium soyangense]